MLNVAYFAFSEKYGANHAGFTHSYNMAKNLSQLCSRVDLFFASDRTGLIENQNRLFIHGVILPSSKNFIKGPAFLKSILYIKKIVRTSDIIHERFHINPIDLLFVRNKPYVLEINDPAMILYSGLKSKLYMVLINKKLRRTNLIITQTQTLKKLLSKYTGKNISVVSNGVNSNLFKPSIKSGIRKKYNIRDSDILIAFSGNFMQWHGTDDIIKLANRFTDVKFMLIGGGPMFNEIAHSAKDISNIILVGSQPYVEVPKYLGAADILIAPFNTSRFKHVEKYGFWWCPVKLFEYLAIGKPIVSYDYPEIRQIVKAAGLFAEPGNLQDLANKLEKLIKNKKLREVLGAKARKISLKNDWKYKSKDVYELYKKLCMMR